MERNRFTAVAAAAVVLTAGGCGGDGDSADTGDPTPSATSAASATSTPSTDDPRAALERLDLAATAKRVAALRKLEFIDGEPKIKITSPKGAVGFVRQQVERSFPTKRLKSDEAYYQLMGIIPADTGLRELFDSFSESLILGYYDYHTPETLQMITSETAAEPKAAESTLAHELVHSLQDQHFGLDKVQEEISDVDADADSAASALVEGDAQAVELAYGKEFLDGGPMTEAETGQLPPAFLLYAIFPYQFGAEFVTALIKEGDGYKLVDQAWEKQLPETTEQILHPEKYLAGEGAKPVTLGAAEILGGEYEAGPEVSFGELDALALLSTKTLPKGAAGKALGAAAEGWDGGARQVFLRGKDRVAVTVTTWESPKEAQEFAKAYEQSLVKDRAGKPSAGAVEIDDIGFAAVSTDGSDVTIAIAPDAALTKRLTG